MPLPSKNAPIWKDLITSRNQHQFEFFAFKLILSRLNMEYEKAPSEQTIDRCTEELISFLEKNSVLPRLQRDIEKVFGKGVMV